MMRGPYHIIAKRAGFIGEVTSELRSEIRYLAKQVGMEDRIESAPRAVADEITRYLDDIVRDP